MAYFRKKPVVIEAVQWLGDNFDEIERMRPGRDVYCAGENVVISTLEGSMSAHRGDWIAKGIKGEFYPIKPEIFADLYDPVTEIEASELKARRDG